MFQSRRNYGHLCYPPIILFFTLFALKLSAQTMQVTNGGTAPFTPENLISNIFLGEGVEVTNISFTGNDLAVGYFTEGVQAVGLERGIVLSTGLTETANPFLDEYGCHESGNMFASTNLNGFFPAFDPDLDPLVSDNLYDLVRYTITFIPVSDTLRFRYCFASEEYPEFSCSNYNDIFGFFIQGPNYPVPTNIALIPGTALPVSINNIHPDYSQPNEPCPPVNLQYYKNNFGSNNQPTFNGLTHVFTAEAIVVPCQTYTIKLALADVGDGNFDSGVFLEAKSFGTGAIQAMLATPGLDGTVTEGCAAGSLSFKLPNPAEADFYLDYNILGNSINGVDYQSIPANLFIPAGEQEIVIPIIAFEDGLLEGGEILAIDFQKDPCNRDTIQIVIRENTMVAPDQLTDTTYCIGGMDVTLNGSLPIAVTPPPSFTNDQDFIIDPVNATISSPINVFGVIPTTLQPGMIRSVCLNVTHNWADDLDVYLVSPGGQILELMTDCGADGKNLVSTCFTPKATKKINQATKVDAPFSGDWLPEGPWSDLWSGGAFPSNGTWQLQIRDDQTGFTGTLQGWTITFEPNYEIGYFWSPANGLSCIDCPEPNASPSVPTTYTLLATDSYGCTLEESVNVGAAEILETPAVSCATFSDNSISFSWPNVPGASGYLVNVNGAGWVPSTGSNGHEVTNLQPSSTITLGVQAIGGTVSCPSLIDTTTCANCNLPVVSSSIQNVSCAGISDGRLSLVPDGLNPPYTFEINGQTNNGGIFTNLPAGNYVASVTDNSGCQAVISVAIAAPPAINVNIDAKGVNCVGSTDGSAFASGSGGNGTLNYKWSDPLGQSTANAINLAVGVYTVTISDQNGCTTTGSVSIEEPAEPLEIEMPFIGDTICFGASNGIAIAMPLGGTPPYKYLWSTGNQNTPKASGLSSKLYWLTVTDANNCTAVDSIFIPQKEEIFIWTESSDIKCFGAMNGRTSVSLAYYGATNVPLDHFSYKWSYMNQTSNEISGLQAGIYTVTATDNEGCTGTMSNSITQPPELQVDFILGTIKCFGEKTGSARAVVSGGTPNYQYQWSTGIQSSQISGLESGIYTLSLTDGQGCTQTDSVEIFQPDAPLDGITTKTDSGCYGGGLGEIQIFAVGGTPPYRYALGSGIWNGSSKQIGLYAGVYQPKIQDKNGCIFELGSVEISQRDPIILDLGPSATIAFGESIQLLPMVQNALDPVLYFWNPEDSIWLSCLDCPDPFVDDLEFGHWFQLEVIDSLGCRAESSVFVNVQKERNVFVPTGFSPNGDGNNDLLLAHGQGETRVIQFQVFDRWGEMVYSGGDFSLNDPDSGWDGNFRGQPMPAEIYVWVLHVEYQDGVREVYRGNTSLIR